MNELERSIMTSSCIDCDSIAKVQEAGRILDTPNGPIQVMHNGLRVKAGGYHGDWMAQIIRALQGHHEPQEELVFHHMLRYVRHNSLIVELGAFWCYYTMWYLHEIANASAICIEPDPNNLQLGKDNASLNRLEDRISFHNGCVGGESLESVELRCESDGRIRALPCFDMAAVSKLANGRTIEILHMDVQGAELPFIRSMAATVESKQVRFVVVSTHHSSISGSRTTHADCREALLDFGAVILAEHDVQQSYSGDGLIAASFFPEDRRIELPPVSLNKATLSLFPER
ncbi:MULTISPECIES: FkbM family methyltransferase [unclassified Mesorhizobium]|uniref:FkbM family methyltransferase n=1 Tax=unclassified Mesorhizobium TaxID=325217 RepID=UPI000F7646BD|nr:MULTISPECIES: FkbM family methyltransferase [unclassified Mesorhizobium]AZO31546.1 FkbM family methyltransferase [Mesorhizobium sp. M1B.F.Ca.ET.045.04.1.1]RWB22900.1 MAG: FkbM family methyltransferase [Mesorhizobium sp.]